MMCNTKTKRVMTVCLALTMTLMVITPAFAINAYDYYEPKETFQPSSMADMVDPEINARYWEEHWAESYREDLYRYVSDEASLLPTDLELTPLPEELGLDPATYWKEISLDGNTLDKTTRSTEELYQEIYQLVSDLTEGLTTPSEKYTAICNWISNNIEYTTDNRTYKGSWPGKGKTGGYLFLPPTNGGAVSRAAGWTILHALCDSSLCIVLMRQQEGRNFRVQFSAPGAAEAAQVIRAGGTLQICGPAATAIITAQGRVAIRAGMLLPAQDDVARSLLIILQSIFFGNDHTRPNREAAAARAGTLKSKKPLTEAAIGVRERLIVDLHIEKQLNNLPAMSAGLGTSLDVQLRLQGLLQGG